MKKQSHVPLSSLGPDTVKSIEVGAAVAALQKQVKGATDDGLALEGEIHLVNAEDVSCDVDADHVVKGRLGQGGKFGFLLLTGGLAFR
jgi:hypothetical protein